MKHPLKICFSSLHLHGFFLALTFTTSISYTLDGHAEVYKWTDEQGNVHFGDHPPDREKATALGNSLKPLNISTDLSNPSMIRKAEQARQDEVLRNANQQQRKQQLSSSEQHQRDCERARKRLRDISGPVVFYDDNGKAVDVTEKEREKMEQALRAEINKNCKQ